jgi:large conductance mechanosensitive channel
MLEGFKKFIMKGNAIDLAVGVVIGAAFGAIVNSFTTNLIQPIITEVLGGGVEGGTVELSPGNVLDFGAVFNAIITFLITAAVVYFVFVMPMNKLQDRRARQLNEPTELSNEEKMVQLLEQIAAK